MFSIGEFSKATGLTAKALRFYHEEGLLVPAGVDPRTGYRQYSPGQVETARVISYLRGLELPVAEIREILADGEGERVLEALVRRREELARRIRTYRKAVRSLDEFISDEREALAMADTTGEIREKVLEPVIIAGIRMRGRYAECGKGFGMIGRKLGRYISGKAMMLHYDTEYKEEDADFEACMPLRMAKEVEGVSMRTLSGGRAVTLVHRGPYDQMGRSYAKVLGYIKEKGYEVVMPTREVYVKGPGMIFKGNPKNYLTEIQVMVK